MANNNRLLIGAATIGLGFLAYKTWNVKRSLQMLDYSISNVSFRFSGLTPVLYFKLLIYNPNKQAIPVNDIVGQVFFKGFDAGTFQNVNPVKIGANQKAAIDMQARLKPGEIIQALLSKTPGASVNIEGVMRTSIVDMPFRYKWDFSKS